MGQNRFWLIVLLGAILALTLTATSHAAPLVFADPVDWIVDTTGDNTGLTPIANTAGNIGKYAAGSWLTLSGSAAGTLAGNIPLAGNFGAQKAPSGAFSTGNPGSLVSYYDADYLGSGFTTNTSFDLGFGSPVDAQTYDGLYPQKSGANIPLTPQIGGGTTALPGSAPADYGASLKVLAVGGAFTAANGTMALRDFTVSLDSNFSSVPLTGSSPNLTFDMLNDFRIQVGGTLDYNVKGNVVLGNTVPDMIGSLDLSGTPRSFTAAGAGTLNRVDPPGGSRYYMLTMPITTTFTETIPGDVPLTLTFTLTGQIAAQGFQAPEPSTLIIAASAVIPLGLMAWRRRRRALA